MALELSVVIPMYNEEDVLPLLVARLRPILDGLLDVFADVKKGDMDPRTGTALASIAGAIVKVYQAGALEERVHALETALAAQGSQEDQ